MRAHAGLMAVAAIGASRPGLCAVLRTVPAGVPGYGEPASQSSRPRIEALRVAATNSAFAGGRRITAVFALVSAMVAWLTQPADGHPPRPSRDAASRSD